MHGEDLGRLLQKENLTIAVAESLTGGLLSDGIAKLPDASTFFRGGLVAYSVDVKRRLLDIGDAPAVSRHAALAMADNVASLLEADVGISVTGVGGPGPEDGVAPGTVWMAIRTPSGTAAMLRNFGGEPLDVIRQACHAAIDAAHLALTDDRD